jgi:hypothetical protein
MSGRQMGEWIYISRGSRESADGRIEEAFLPWLRQTVDLMIPHLPPVSDDFVPQPSTSLPLPIFTLEYTAPSFNNLSLSGETNCSDAETASSRVVDQMHGVGSSSSKPDDWMWATLTRNKRVTKEGWYQDVREIELQIEDDE